MAGRQFGSLAVVGLAVLVRLALADAALLCSPLLLVLCKLQPVSTRIGHAPHALSGLTRASDASCARRARRFSCSSSRTAFMAVNSAVAPTTCLNTFCVCDELHGKYSRCARASLHRSCSGAMAGRSSSIMLHHVQSAAV